MISADKDPVFGRGPLRVATGDHVEVWREAAAPGERRRYRKHYLKTALTDYRPWTERERRVLEALGRHPGAPVADLAPETSGDDHGRRGANVDSELITFDAGPSVDQWATLVVLRRGGTALTNVFEDCACWWSLARDSLRALDTVHALGFVHLDLKADNLCVPWGEPAADHPVRGQRLLPRFDRLTLIDVAFSLLPGVELRAALPLAGHHDYEYQSPRLLQALEDGRYGDLTATRALDWRCDFFSLAAMLWRYLPEPKRSAHCGWTQEGHAAATDFVRQLVGADAAKPVPRPHRSLIALAERRLGAPDMVTALGSSCTFDFARAVPAGGELTPPTRLYQPLAKRARSVARASARPADPSGTADTPNTAAASAEAAASAPAPLADSRSAAPVHVPSQAAPERPAATAPSAPASTPPSPSPEPLPEGWVATPPRTEVAAVRYGLRLPRLGPLAAIAGLLVAAVAAVMAWHLQAPTAVRSRAEDPLASAFAPAATPPSAPSLVPRVEAPETSPAPLAELPLPAVAAASEPQRPADVAVAAPGRAAPQLDPPAEIASAPVASLAEAAAVRIAPVLTFAGATPALRPAADVRSAARAARSHGVPPSLDGPVDRRQARTLNDAARVAYEMRGDIDEALRLQARAFAANPLDTEVAGNLAYYRLRNHPPEAETARQLVLHALTLHDPRFASGRIQDWTTLAVASALTGRDSDARGAWAVTLALAPDLRSHCSAAVRSESIYGERLQPSVEAMLERVRTSRGYGNCLAGPVRDAARAAPPGHAVAAAPRRPRAQAKPYRPTAKATAKVRRAGKGGGQ